MKTRMYFTEIVTGIYIAVFLFTAISKWAGNTEFYNQLRLMPVFSQFPETTAYAFPSVMGLLALWLVFGTHRRLPLLICITILTGMIVYIILILRFVFGPTYPCSCAGLLNLSWPAHLYGNITLALLGLATVILIRPAAETPLMNPKWLFFIIKRIFSAENTGKSLRPGKIKGGSN